MTKSKQKSSILNLRAMTEGGIMIAIAYLLSVYIKLFQMPQGGSVNLTCLPLIIYAYRWGWKKGLFASIAFATLHFILDPYHVFHPISILGDYFVSYGIIAIVGIGSNNKVWKPIAKIIAVFTGRYIAATLSGAIVFASYAGDLNPWIYSLGYNSYLFVEAAVVAVAFAALYPVMNAIGRLLPVRV